MAFREYLIMVSDVRNILKSVRWRIYFWRTAGFRVINFSSLDNNPFHPDCIIFFFVFLLFFRFIFKLLRRKRDCYVKFAACSS